MKKIKIVFLSMIASSTFFFANNFGGDSSLNINVYAKSNDLGKKYDKALVKAINYLDKRAVTGNQATKHDLYNYLTKKEHYSKSLAKKLINNLGSESFKQQ